MAGLCPVDADELVPCAGEELLGTAVPLPAAGERPAGVDDVPDEAAPDDVPADDAPPDGAAALARLLPC